MNKVQNSVSFGGDASCTSCGRTFEGQDSSFFGGVCPSDDCPSNESAAMISSLIDQVRQLDSATGFKPRMYSLTELSGMSPDDLRKIANTAATELDITKIQILPAPLTPDTLRVIANRMSTMDFSHD